MEKTCKVAVIVGSLWRDSLNGKVAHTLAELAPVALKLSLIEIGHLPIYNQDGEENPPAAWTQFREWIRATDAVIVVTPEHNRSIPAALKNAIDVGLRPYGKSAWNGKLGAFVSASPCGIGANHHLQQSSVFLNISAMTQPKTYPAAVPISYWTRMASILTTGHAELGKHSRPSSYAATCTSNLCAARSTRD